MKKILILGGGFAGIYTAKNLQKQNLEDYEIELISENEVKELDINPLLVLKETNGVAAADTLIRLDSN